MATNGLFYLNHHDLVQCAYCKGVIGYWEDDDVPEIEHRKHYPRCPFVQGHPVTNIKINGTPLEHKLEEYLKERLDGQEPPRYNCNIMKGILLNASELSLTIHKINWCY